MPRKAKAIILPDKERETLEKLKILPDDSMDLIFADPPYNLQLRDHS